MGEDELLSDKRWEQEDLNSDEEVRTSEERMLTAAKNDTGEIPQIFQMTPQSVLEPVAESSKGIRISEENNCFNTQQETTPRPACMKKYQKSQH